tara:strand:+ start:2875 stop:3591 length:717 start_codon:yes stop_codon:yes gene_type:complete
MKLKTKRLHDKLYLRENRYKKPKENFKFFMRLLKSHIYKNKSYKLLDIGCANGELLWNLNKSFNNLSLYGLDIRGDLIKKAKKYCKNVKFFKKNIAKNNTFVGKFDIIIISGVLSCTNDPSVVIKNLKNNLNKKGMIFLFDNMTDFKFNSFLKYQDLVNENKILQSGYNIYSVNLIVNLFKKIVKAKKTKIAPFFIKKEIKQHKNDLMRSWTIKINNKRYFTNATGLILKQFWIIAKT